jgi:O-antigen/teichoic acid export membrane protein
MVPYLQILCLAGITFPHRSINLNVLLVKGRSDLFLKLDVLKIIIGLSLIALVIYFDYGIYGLLWTSFINCKIAFIINSYYSKKYISYSTKEQIKDMMLPLIISALMGIIVYFSGTVLPDNNLTKLVGQIIIGIIAYLSLSKLAKVEELDTIYELAGNAFQKIKYRKVVK